MKRVLLIGLGMQGQAALHDMAVRPEFSRIVAADSRDDLDDIAGRYSAEKVATVRADATDELVLTRLIREADIVVEALPAALALRTGQLAARCGVPVVSSMYYFNSRRTGCRGRRGAARIGR
ncbi:MAG: saccharopine dehydrogenase NADP-binding domain-containing protein [Bryobacteraceae bacterium]